MAIRGITVFHQRKGELASSCAMPSTAFEVNTCQRRVWVTLRDSADFSSASTNSLEIFRGQEAYRFLLQFATGLESQVKGEADVFGQFKKAWSIYELAQTESAKALRPWINKLFEDTKEIRALHLQNLGSKSYGGLVRQWLNQRKLQTPLKHVTVFGAGELAQSVLPWLSDFSVSIWNRSESGWSTLQQQFPGSASSWNFFTGTENRERSTDTADAVIFCIPFDEPPMSNLRVPVLHLGGLLAEAGPGWREIPNLACLDDLFALQNQSAAARQLDRAYRACSEKAQLRALSGLASVTHGWEDLAIFA